MKNFLLTSCAVFALAGNAYAADISGSVKLDVTQNSSDKWVGKNSIDLGFGSTLETGAFGSIDLGMVDGGAVALDGWSLGTAVNGMSVSVGDQGDLFPGAGLEVVGDDTLADPSTSESIIVSLGDASFMAAVKDYKTDMTELQNLQLGYSAEVNAIGVGVALDYNMDTEEFAYGADVSAEIQGAAVGAVITYANEEFAYEASASYSALTAFVNGDMDEMAQNVGGQVATDLGGINVFAETAYNLDDEAWTPAVGASFNF